MARLSLTLSTVALSMSLAPMAFAYADEPSTPRYSLAALGEQETDVASDPASACVVDFDNALVKLIGLNPGWQPLSVTDDSGAVACL